jgi:hypothetical protein
MASGLYFKIVILSTPKGIVEGEKQFGQNVYLVTMSSNLKQFDIKKNVINLITNFYVWVSGKKINVIHSKKFT